MPAFRLVHDFPNRKQRAKTGNLYKIDLKLLRQLLFNIFLLDIFFILKDVDVANFIDSNTTFARNTEDLIDSLENIFNTLIETSKKKRFPVLRQKPIQILP